MIGDGYPYPGGPGADRIAVPVSSGLQSRSKASSRDADSSELMMTIFYNREHAGMVYNLSYIKTDSDNPSSTGEHQAFGADHRRSDFMMPQAYTVIDSQLKIHYL